MTVSGTVFKQHTNRGNSFSFASAGFGPEDTDGLNGLQRLLKGDRPHPSALPVFVFFHVRPPHCSRHAEHLLQLLPAHLKVQLERKHVCESGVKAERNERVL